jgi:hypothetical protein
MGIIISIRKFLRLDMATLSPDSNFVDAMGLYLAEQKEFMKPPSTGGGCFGYHHEALPAKHGISICSDHHLPVELHSPHYFHF